MATAGGFELHGELIIFRVIYIFSFALISPNMMCVTIFIDQLQIFDNNISKKEQIEAN